MRPIFEHDCQHCTFLGTFHMCAPEGQQFADLYVCCPRGKDAHEQERDGHASLIVRYSSEPSDYTSTPVRHLNMFSDMALHVAFKAYLRLLDVWQYGLLRGPKDTLNHVYTNRSDIIVLQYEAAY